ncbi:hypothetical protein BDR07DRAFT_1424076 [Suillus spraguei]|nr:hypothetical protein BDR07DRAFT_1424076 [Suillus spraguei]
MYDPRIDQARSALSSLLGHRRRRVSYLPNHQLRGVSPLAIHQACTARSHPPTLIHLVPYLPPYLAQFFPPQRVWGAQKLQPSALHDEQRREWGWLWEWGCLRPCSTKNKYSFGGDVCLHTDRRALSGVNLCRESHMRRRLVKGIGNNLGCFPRGH